MSEESSVLEKPKIDRKKLDTLVKLLDSMGIKGCVENIDGIEAFVCERGTNLLTIVGNKLIYAANPYGTFRLTKLELDNIKNGLGIDSIRLLKEYAYLFADEDSFKKFFSIYIKTN